MSSFVGYWHQVRSNGYMNTAVSIWFSKITHFDPTGCPSKIPPSMTLRDVDVLWRYPGHGDFTHGNHDIYMIKKLLLSWADEDGNIDLNTLTRKFFVYNKESSKQKLFQDDTKQRAQKVTVCCNYENYHHSLSLCDSTTNTTSSTITITITTTQTTTIIPIHHHHYYRYTSSSTTFCNSSHSFRSS